MRKILTIFCIFSLISCSQESENLRNLRIFIDASNTFPNNIQLIDSLLADDFKYISDSISETKFEYMKRFESSKAIDTLWRTELDEIIEAEFNINTYELRTGYLITTLGVEPISREREYRFNNKNQIKSIYTLKTYEPPIIAKFGKYFDIWAAIYYPELFDELREKRKNGEDYFDEFNYLIIKLKKDGLNMLDSADIIYKTYLKEKENKKRINTLPAVPLIDYYFERILSTFGSLAVAENVELPVKDPLTMKKILVKAFTKNGYSYSSTLHKLAEFGFTSDELPYVQIMLAPIIDLENDNDIAKVYSGQDLADIQKIINLLNNY